jgi:uncharacterized protein (DUF433 family)
MRTLKEREALALIERHIEQDPSRPGPADARLVQYALPVWTLVGAVHAVDGEAERVSQDYQIPVEAVEAAIVYYLRHKAAIDARLAAQDS